MGVRVPSIAVEHQYLITDPIPDLPKAMPTLARPRPACLLQAGGARHCDRRLGGRHADLRRGRHTARIRPAAARGQFRSLQAAGRAPLKRTPIVEKVGVRQLINGPDSVFHRRRRVRHGRRRAELDNAFVCAGSSTASPAGGGAERDDGGVDRRAGSRAPQPVAARYPAVLLPSRTRGTSCTRAPSTLRQVTTAVGYPRVEA